MAKRGTPLGFSYVPSKVEGYFAFISGATTVSGIFLALFGLTAFGYMLTGDANINLYTVLQGLSQLPNPLNFIRDCNQIMVAFSNMLNRVELNVSNANLPAILEALVNIATGVVRIIGYIITFVISALMLPFYLVWFCLRCFAVLLNAIGLGSVAPLALNYEWQPVSWIIGLLGGN